MGKRFYTGFTLIETMLFLAITGALVAGVLIGTGTSINNQRYRDAVESLKSLIQTQYSEIGSVKNDRSNNLSCGTSGTSATPTTGSQYRGQSSCVIVGRYMVIDGTDSNGASKISIYTVLAKQKSTTERSSDIETMKNNYTYSVTPEVETNTMEWSTQIAWPKSGAGSKSPTTPRSIGILFIRSPETGTIYTFSTDTVANTASSAFTNMMVAGASVPGRGERTICVKSSGVSGGDRAIYIAPSAASASAIEIQTNDLMKSASGNGASQC